MLVYRKLSYIVLTVLLLSVLVDKFYLTKDFASSVSPNANIELKPSIIYIKGTAGEKFNEDIEIINNSATSINTSLSLSDFSPEGSNGNVRIYNGSNGSIFSMLNIVKLADKTLKIPANSFVYETLNFTIPNNIPEGSYYGLFFVSPNDNLNSNGSKASSSQTILYRIGTDIILTVSNSSFSNKANISPSIHIDNFNFDNNIILSGSVSNNSVYATSFSTSINITNILFNKNKKITYSNIDVLSKSSRYIDGVDKKILLSEHDGVYRVNVKITNLIQNKTYTYQAYVIVLSVYTVFYTLLSIVLLLIVIYFLSHRRRRYYI